MVLPSVPDIQLQRSTPSRSRMHYTHPTISSNNKRLEEAISNMTTTTSRTPFSSPSPHPGFPPLASISVSRPTTTSITPSSPNSNHNSRRHLFLSSPASPSLRSPQMRTNMLTVPESEKRSRGDFELEREEFEKRIIERMDEEMNRKVDEKVKKQVNLKTEEFEKRIIGRMDEEINRKVDERVKEQVNLKTEAFNKHMEEIDRRIKSLQEKEVPKHNAKKKYQCTLCDWRGVNPSVVKAHMTRKHK
eukprot:GFUD01074171.1.p1 GENE.GFUD01074171.1~~GFUD01074171.1.p1  ORF type:complete len:271 (+),score=93.03 GFUD01074171.1:76-813(+)